MSRNAFSRRRFLVGLYGATVALPLLESFGRLDARGQSMPHPGFAVFVRAGNGVARESASRMEPEQFWPSQSTGALTVAGLRAQSGRAVSELADYAPKLNILSGVSRPFGTPNCGHAESIPQCLTGRAPTMGNGNVPLATGLSADWAIAHALNSPGREPMTLMAGPTTAYIAEGLSWRDAMVRDSAQRSPLAVYMSIMGLSAMPPDAQRRIAAARMSVNDLVRGEIQALLSSSALGANDRSRLQQHFDAIRDTELQLACNADSMLATNLAAIPMPEDNDVRPDVVRRFMDVIALAFSCGLTHAATLQVGEGNDQTQYIINGVRLPKFHWISHRIESDGSAGTPIAGANDLHHQVDVLQLQMFKYLLDKLSSYPSPYGSSGTLLDACAAVWLNDLGDGPPHSGQNVPWIIAGGANGALRTGNYVELGGVTINRVLNSILTAVGVRKADGSNIDNFGDPTLTGGLVSQIMA